MTSKAEDAGANSGIRYQDLSRMLALSDGVFSIVITLLIFDIKTPVPPLGSSFGDAELVSALLALSPKFLTYIGTFLVIGVYWVGHQAVMRHVLSYDRAFVWLNILFLMCVCLMPFPTSLLGSYWKSQVAVVIYGSSLVLTGGALSLLWWYATSHHRLVAPTLDQKVIALGYQRLLMAPLAAMISILVSPLSVKLSLGIYLLAGAAYFLPSRIDRHLRK